MTNWNGIKLFRHSDRIKTFLEGGIPDPVSIELHPTNRCNYDCIWCEPRILNKFDKTLEMNEEDLSKIIRELKEFNLKALLYSGGGEPLLNPATLPSMKLANSLGISVGLFTNGALIDDATAKDLVQICTFIRITFDAGNREMHSQVHRCNSYDRVIDNCKTLVKYKKEFGSKVTLGGGYVISPESYMGAKDAIDLFDEFGFDYIQFRPARYEKLAVGDYILQEVRELVESESKNRRISVLFVPHFGTNYYGAEKRSYNKCYIYNFQGIIIPDGNLYTCYGCVHKNCYPLGNVKKEGFKNVWMNKKLDLDPIKDCTECRFHHHNELLEQLKRIGHEDFL
ncbi:MAG TPA: radical SAM protein [Candidatus Nanoarchaeia archaeon]|nr:radical SAM protein [Candidatus Nanoarchaeia archaeon]